MGYEIDFLPVGEGERSGDAISLRFGNLNGERNEQTFVVIDGGTKEAGAKIVAHIKKYYQTDYIDLAVSTHPDDDHSSGLEVVMEELQVRQLWMHRPWNHADNIKGLFKDGRVTDSSIRESLRKSLETAYNLEQIAEAKEIPTYEPFKGLEDSSGHLRVLGPTEPFYEDLLPYFTGTPEPKYESSLLAKVFHGMKEVIHKVAERWDLETLDDTGETTAENNSSTILLLTFDDQNLLFTADAGIPALTEVVNYLESFNFDFGSIKFVQVPHHGSKRNIGPYILDRLVGPKLKEKEKRISAFVSVSKKGEPKHPSKKVTNAFLRRGASVHVTKGCSKLHHNDSPDRGWKESIPLPFFEEFEE